MASRSHFYDQMESSLTKLLVSEGLRLRSQLCTLRAAAGGVQFQRVEAGKINDPQCVMPVTVIRSGPLGHHRMRGQAMLIIHPYRLKKRISDNELFVDPPAILQGFRVKYFTTCQQG